ncbi:MAG: hypothetical protein R3B90_22695 [Planctomycetaceae bacterium]
MPADSHNTSDGTPRSFVSAAAGWIGISLSVGLFYLLAYPWIVLFLCACNDDFMNSNHPLGRLVELSMYPAIQLADNFELYDEYLGKVLAPLGG